MKLKQLTRVAMLSGLLVNPLAALAATIDWSGVTLGGAFPNFTFSDAMLGDVSLSYSGDTEFFGIQTVYVGDETLQLGNTGGETLTMSWTNAATSLDIAFWDVDGVSSALFETLDIDTAAVVSLVSLSPTDVWNAGLQQLSGDGTADSEFDPDNFSVLNFSSPGGFNSITFNWAVGGTGVVGIGDITSITTVSAPASLALLIPGLIVLAARRRSRQHR